jgi:hypothetical protein
VVAHHSLDVQSVAVSNAPDLPVTVLGITSRQTALGISELVLLQAVLHFDRSKFTEVQKIQYCKQPGYMSGTLKGRKCVAGFTEKDGCCNSLKMLKTRAKNISYVTYRALLVHCSQLRHMETATLPDYE